MKNRAAILLLLIFSMFSLTKAQANFGSIEGTVVDQNGAVILNATIKATLKKADGDKVERTTESNVRGEFAFSGLPFGIYELELKVGWADIEFKKRVEIKSSAALKTNIVFSLEGCSNEDNGIFPSITDEDRAEIVQQMLKFFLEKHANLLLEDQAKSKIILSAENIQPNWILPTQKQKFSVMKQSEIQQKADTNRDFPYFSFSKITARGNCVAVSLNNGWAVGKNSGMAYLSGGGYTYEFRKIEGRWVGKSVMGWIS